MRDGLGIIFPTAKVGKNGRGDNHNMLVFLPSRHTNFLLNSFLKEGLWVFLGVAYDDGKTCYTEKYERVVKVLDDGSWRYLGKTARHQKLSAVGDYPLYYTGECVQDARGFSGIETVFSADVLRYLACGYYGNSVVRRAKVGKADESCDAEFRTPFSFKASVARIRSVRAKFSIIPYPAHFVKCFY